MSSLEQPASIRIQAMLVAMLILAAALQSRLPGWIEFAEVPADLALSVAVAGGLMDGPITGAWLGLVAAYLRTAAVPLSPGSFYFSHVVVGYLSGLPRRRFYTDNPLVPAAWGFVAGVVSETLFYLLTPRSPVLLLQGALVQGCCCMAATPVFYGLLQAQARREAA